MTLHISVLSPSGIFCWINGKVASTAADYNFVLASYIYEAEAGKGKASRKRVSAATAVQVLAKKFQFMAKQPDLDSDGLEITGVVPPVSPIQDPPHRPLEQEEEYKEESHNSCCISNMEHMVVGLMKTVRGLQGQVHCTIRGCFTAQGIAGDSGG